MTRVSQADPGEEPLKLTVVAMMRMPFQQDLIPAIYAGIAKWGVHADGNDEEKAVLRLQVVLLRVLTETPKMSDYALRADQRLALRALHVVGEWTGERPCSPPEDELGCAVRPVLSCPCKGCYGAVIDDGEEEDRHHGMRSERRARCPVCNCYFRLPSVVSP